MLATKTGTFSCSLSSKTSICSRASKLRNVSRPRLQSVRTRRLTTIRTLARTAGGGGETLFWAEEVQKSYDGQRVLFDNLTFTISRGDRLAVVGSNGSGKSTLLKMVCGREDADSGRLQHRKGIQVSIMTQESELPVELSVMDAVLSGESAGAKAVRDYERATLQGDSDLIQKAVAEIDANDAWTLQSEARRVLESLKCNISGKVGDLSGGQRRRVNLAAALLSNPDLLVLDEPTNHMDIETIQWMEKYLIQPDLTLLLVSHDRYFLEQICTRMIELSAGTGFLHTFGGEGSYLKMCAARAERIQAQQHQVDIAKNKLRKETEWMRRQPKARSTKSRSRIDSFYQLQAVASNTPQGETKAEFGATMTRIGTKVMEVKDVAVKVDPSAEKPLFSGLSYTFSPGERVGIVGANGAGKSTLLKFLIGTLEPVEGERIVGETIVFGFLEQEPPEVPGDVKILDYIRDFTEREPGVGEVTGGGEWANMKPENILERCGFPRARQQQRCAELSGGERRRLHLAQVLLKRPNFLILDEPTNDLDLQTIEVLEDFLQSYQGCLAVVSHDRSFMDNTVDSLFVLKGDGKVQGFAGAYTEYLQIVEEELQEQKNAEAAVAMQATLKEKPSPSAQAAPQAAKPKKLNWREQKEYEGLEAEIEALEEQKDEISATLAQGLEDYEKMLKLTEELASVGTLLDEKSERWMELAERAEG